jgi:hypothetical protein
MLLHEQVCRSIAVATVAIGAAAAAMQYQQAQSAAKAQNQYVAENAELAAANARQQYADLQARQLQEFDAQAQQNEDINLTDPTGGRHRSRRRW